MILFYVYLLILAAYEYKTVGGDARGHQRTEERSRG